MLFAFFLGRESPALNAESHRTWIDRVMLALVKVVLGLGLEYLA